MIKQFAEQIKAMIEEECKTDTDLKVLTEKPNKSYEECAKYIIGEAYNTCKNNKQGNVGYWCGVDNTPLINLVVHYYTEDDIKITELPSNVSVKATAGSTPPKPKAAEVKPKTTEVKPIPQPTVAAPKKKKEEKKSNVVQLDLFASL